jgi:rubrerythrin
MRDECAAEQNAPQHLPRRVRGEWLCLDCRHLSYGHSPTPRCPNCQGLRLAPTVEPAARADERARQRARATG